jgi:glycerol uptake facilitator-like aquaporin
MVLHQAWRETAAEFLGTFVLTAFGTPLTVHLARGLAA